MKKNIIIFLVFILNFTLYAFHMSPDGFQKRIDTGASQEYTFINNTGRPVRYKFDVLPGDSNKSMHEWIQFEPKYLNIDAGESKKLKVFAKSPKDTPIGEYNFFLNIQTLPIPNKIKITETGDVSTAPRIGFSVNVEMIGWVGDLPADLNFSNLKLYKDQDILKVKGLVNNKTKKRSVRYMIDIIGKNRTRETFYGGVVEASTSQEIIFNLNKFKNKSDIWKIEVKETLSKNLLQTISF